MFTCNRETHKFGIAFAKTHSNLYCVDAKTAAVTQGRLVVDQLTGLLHGFGIIWAASSVW